MADVTVTTDVDTFLQSTDNADARSNLGLTALATTTPGTSVATALGVAVGSAGAIVVNGGALGTPSSGTLTSCTFPTLNQSTTGSAATLTTARTINGVSFNGSTNITVTAAGSTLSDTVTVANGGTGATTADTARTALGLGTTDTPTFADLDLFDAATSTTTLNIYNLLSGGNTEQLSLRWASNVARIGTAKGGSGTPRDLVIETDGTERARFTAAGVFSVAGVNVGLGGGSISTNTAVGFRALNANTTGLESVAIGSQALLANTTGSRNFAGGTSALIRNTTGNDNNAIGTFALFNNISGSENVAIGSRALIVNTSSSNTAIGHQSLTESTTGGQNLGIGWRAGRFIADGTTANSVTTNSVYIGANTKALASGQTNQIVIGHDATGLGSNTAVLGNDSITLTALKGSVAIGATTAASKLTVTGGDVEVVTIASGLILKSPDGTRYRLTVANGGALTTSPA